MDFLITAIIFIVILSVLVIVHEAGHYFAAKKAGVKVEEFGFGLPPKIWGRQRGETEFTLNALPIGGFVRLYGETPDGISVKSDNQAAAHGDAQRAFLAKSKWARAGILLAGVASNLVLGILIFTLVYSLGLPTFDAQPKVEKVESNSPAAAAGLHIGDTVTQVNGKSTGMSDFSQIIKEHLGQPVDLTVRNSQGRDHQTSVTPRQNAPAGQGPLGITLTSGKIYVASTERYPVWQAGWVGIKEALIFAWTILASLGSMLGGLLTHAKVPSDLAGPIGIAAILGQARALGLVPVLWFAGIISINLAVVNVLPFPALDGGRLLFVVIEAITGHQVNPEIERKVHTVGMAVLLTLIVLITISDIRRLL